MKQLFTLFAGIFLLTTISCTKEEHNEVKQQTVAPQMITANVPAGETYVLNMGVGSSASITTQAQHFQYSEVSTARDGSTVYKYIAAKGYSGVDAVTLQQTITSATSSSHEGGCSHNHTNGSTTTTKTVLIKFNVAN